jgi:hypothetical protein
MAWEAEVNEPLAVQQPRGLLEQLHPPPVVLDQVVVSGNDITDPYLGIFWRERDLDPVYIADRKLWLCNTTAELFNLRLKV